MAITLRSLERIQFAANVNQGGSFPWTLKMIFPSFLLWEINWELWFCHQCHLHYKSFLFIFEKNKVKVRRKCIRLLTELCFFHIICIHIGPFPALWRYQPITEKTSKSRMFLSIISRFACSAVVFLRKTPGLCVTDRRTSAIFCQPLWLS